MLVTTSILFLAAVGIRVLWPALDAEQDRRLVRLRMEETQLILKTLYQLAEDNPAHEFPETISQIAPRLVAASVSPRFSQANFDELVKQYVYIRPEPRYLKEFANDRIILVEKPGHYPHRKGAVVGCVGMIVRFYYLEDLKRLLARNNIPFDRVAAEK